MYRVVEFEGTHEVELVPGVWVKEGACWWPPFRGKQLVNAIKQQILPETNWTQYNVRQMFETDNFEQGRRKVREAELHSDLQSEVDDLNQRKQRRIMPSRRLSAAAYQSASDSDEERGGSRGLPEAPPISTKFFTTLQPVLDLAGPHHYQDVRPQQTSLPQHSAPPSVCQSNGQSLWSHYSPQQLPMATNETCEAVMKEILTKQEMILEQQSLILKLLQAQQQTPTDNIEEGLLPLKDLEALHALEGQLHSLDMREKLINHLGLTGGNNTKETVWRIMKRTLGNSLAKTINWRGLNGKTSFASLQLKDVITAAVRKNPLTKHTTNNEAENVMKRWLQLSSDREGGRKRRMEK
ncbi:uncharacterized protein [Paramormyrops kingsleyae]|uniref:Uncharacterized LOC111858703 n=2 Tax=Paramormyrops kingsleyae TaxID=1676925 RepID=A0A3B3QTX5_9TELE|nr:uncharacterized protein LOC111858703 isoform X2 [Paramormyrops kingsleyae]XP_023696455.1 uncharacterized protein LOC111858703 isoform X2 [Paramormyrops kingsleyae]